MSRLVSKRVKKLPQDSLTEDRYQFLGLEQAEPDLGDPLVGPSSIGAKPVPIGQQYIIVSVPDSSSPGERYWIPNQGGITPGSISIYNEGLDNLVGGLSSTTQLNFIGLAVTAKGYLNPDNNPAPNVDITIFAPGNEGEILFNASNDFSTSNKLTFNSNTGILNIQNGIKVGSGGTIISTVDNGFVGIGTTNPQEILHVNGNLFVSGFTTSLGNFYGDLIGNSDTTTKLNTSRTIEITDDLVWSVTFDGSESVTSSGILTTVNNDVGTFGDTESIPIITVDAKGRITSVQTVGVAYSDATVFQSERAKTISTTTDGSYYLTFVDSDNIIGNIDINGPYENLYTNSGIVFNPNTNNLGIGTTDPTKALQVGGVIGFNDTNIRLGDNTTGTGGSFNFFGGISAGRCNISGSNNNFFGNSAGFCNLTGCHNNFFGLYSGYSNCSGSNNNFFGNNAGFLNLTGSNNNVFGNSAGRNNTSGSNNNFFGNSAGRNNTSACNNNFFGNSAGFCNLTGCNNNFFGLNSGFSNQTGCHNNFFGSSSGFYNQEGCYNNFFGILSGFRNKTGSYNNFLGTYAGRCNDSGCYNNAIGYYSGYYNSTGNNNIFFGTYTGISTSASNKIVIGNGFSLSEMLDSPDIAKSNQLAIGLRTDSNPSKYWIIGDENFNVGIGTTNLISKLTVGGNVKIDGDSNSISLNVSGISTLGTVKVSSGVITSTSGIVTYYGDASNLIGLTGAASSVYGDVSTIPVITVDTNGRITSIGTSAINIVPKSLQSDQIRTISTDNSSSYYLTFVDSNNNDGDYEYVYTNSKISYNPDSSTLNISGLVTSQNLNVSGISSFNSVEIIDLTSQYLNVSGISTLGTVKVSSGVITSTSGIVTYYGDASNLIGLTGAASSVYGDVSTIPVITVDTNGRITSIGTSSVDLIPSKKIDSFSVGIGSTVFDSISKTSDSLEYRMMFLNNSNTQVVRLVVINDGTNLFLQENDIFYHNNMILSIDAIDNGVNYDLYLISEQGISGIITYKYTKQTIIPYQ